MANAFFILGLIMSLFSILAFDLYAADAPDEFGSFSRAFFSMFQAQSRLVCSCCAEMQCALNFWLLSRLLQHVPGVGVLCCIIVLSRNAARPKARSLPFRSPAGPPVTAGLPGCRARQAEGVGSAALPACVPAGEGGESSRARAHMRARTHTHTMHRGARARAAPFRSAPGLRASTGT